MRRVRTRDRKVLEYEGAGFIPDNANSPHRREFRTPLRLSAQAFVPAVFGALYESSTQSKPSVAEPKLDALEMSTDVYIPVRKSILDSQFLL